METPTVPPQPTDQPLTKRQRREQRKQERLQQQRQSNRSDRTSRLLWIVIFLVAAGGLTWLLVSAGGNGSTGSSDFTTDTTDPAQGPADAAVVVREYSDFQCPACKAAEPFVANLIETYKDRVRFEYNDYPLTTIHKNALAAANAAQCAADQGKFWEYHDTLFDKQGDWSDANSSGLRTFFLSYADTVGLDRDAFTACYDEQRFQDRVQQDINEGNSHGVSGTPTFFINNDKVQITSSYDELRAALDQALANVQADTTSQSTNQ